MADDWISALQRLVTQGTRDPLGSEIGAAQIPDWYFEQRGRQGRSRSGEAEALPLGDMADPVSQIAAIIAPMLRSQMQVLGARPPVSPTRLRWLRSERGSSESMDELQRLFEARQAERQPSYDRFGLAREGPREHQPPLTLKGGAEMAREESLNPTLREQARRARLVRQEEGAMERGGEAGTGARAPKPPPAAGTPEALDDLFKRLDTKRAQHTLTPQEERMWGRLREHLGKAEEARMRQLRQRALRLDQPPSTREERAGLELLRRQIQDHDLAAYQGLGPELTVRERVMLRNLDAWLGPHPSPDEGLEPF